MLAYISFFGVIGKTDRPLAFQMHYQRSAKKGGEIMNGRENVSDSRQWCFRRRRKVRLCIALQASATSPTIGLIADFGLHRLGPRLTFHFIVSVWQRWISLLS